MKKVFIGIGIAVVIVVIVILNMAQNLKGMPAFAGGKVFDVKVEKITKQDISSTISASGVVEEVEKQEVYFETPLKVKKLLVKKDDVVTKGQKLVEPDLDSMMSEYEQLKVNRTIQEIAVKKIRDLDSTKGTAALEVAVEQALAAIKTDERNLVDGQREYERNKKLFEAGAISQAELERIDKNVKDLAGKLELSKMGLQTAKSNLEEAVRTNSQASSQKSIDLENAEQQLMLTTMKITDMERKIARLQENTLSPMDGVVIEVTPVEGGFLPTAQPAFKIIDNGRLQVRADVKEYDIKKVKVGQQVSITGDAVDEKEGVTGRVKSISNIAKKNKTTSGDETLVEIIVTVEKSIPVLKPGLSVTCKVVTENRKGVPVATFMMLRDDKDGNKSVWVVDKEGILREKKVTLGLNSDLNVEILEGISENDEVVVNPAPNLIDGARARKTADVK